MTGNRLPVLDGVRAISIGLVLAAHLLPLYFFGHKLNESIGMLGMALFFGLSGFLITRQIVAGATFTEFIVRRLCRVVPAAWVCLAITFHFIGPEIETALRNYLFIANLPPQTLIPPLEHFWSLNLEMQFYLFSAILIGFNRNLVWVIFPVLLLAVIGIRINDGVMAGSLTIYRADDLLAGACAALLFMHPRISALAGRLGFGHWVLTVTMLVGLVLSTLLLKDYPGNPFLYMHSIFLLGLLVSLIFNKTERINRLLTSRPLVYVASISYAIYLWHMPLAATWLGSGDLLEKYLKRPLLMACVFAVAHLSTFTIERAVSNAASRFIRNQQVSA